MDIDRGCWLKGIEKAQEIQSVICRWSLSRTTWKDHRVIFYLIQVLATHLPEIEHPELRRNTCNELSFSLAALLRRIVCSPQECVDVAARQQGRTVGKSILSGTFCVLS
jgi:hypothetical protein